MNKWMTKKKILFIGLLASIAALMRGFSLWCNVNDWDCRDKNDSILLFFMVFIPALIFSLFTYPMSDKIFRTWRNFSLAFIPLTIFLVAITPETSGSIVAFGKETISIILSIIFFVSSIVIISVTWLIQHFKRKGK